MKLSVKFEENNVTMPADFSAQAQPFDAGFGETSVIHDGQNGATFTPAVSADGVISWSNDRDLPNPEPVNIKGADGKDGQNGRDGVDGRTPVKGTDYFDGKDGYTPVKGVDYFDGVDGKDGKDGINGQDGRTPVKGVDYFDGKDGYTPVKGVDYFDGADGKNGIDGRTPVKGTDYFTAADKAEMVTAVINALPVYGGETA